MPLATMKMTCRIERRLARGVVGRTSTTPPLMLRMMKKLAMEMSHL